VVSGQLEAVRPFDVPVARALRLSAPIGVQGLETPALDAALGRLREWRGKRAVDLTLSLLVAVVLAPIALFTALAIWLESPGSPVLFRQKRVGRRNREFWMLKFRTMHPDAEAVLYADGELLEQFIVCDHKIPAHLDPRITRIGRFLRRYSLDEIPQLLNVMAGEMSLVGPRPVERSQLSQYQDRKPYYLAVRPGLTGLWQVGGRSRVKFPVRAELDEHYVRNCTFLTDLKVLLRTPLAVLRGLNED
jgi:exopolysaccharide production protein ExoY